MIQFNSFFGFNFWFCSWKNQSCLAFFGGMQFETTVCFNSKEWIGDSDRQIGWSWKHPLQICVSENLSPLSVESHFLFWTISEKYHCRGLTLKITGCNIEIAPFEIKNVPTCSMRKYFLPESRLGRRQRLYFQYVHISNVNALSYWKHSSCFYTHLIR